MVGPCSTLGGLELQCLETFATSSVCVCMRVYQQLEHSTREAAASPPEHRLTPQTVTWPQTPIVPWLQVLVPWLLENYRISL